MSKFGSLRIYPQLWGVDGEPELRSNTDPQRWANIQAGIDNLGWGQHIRFALDPNAADGSPLAPGDVPGYRADGSRTRFPLICWSAWYENSAGERISSEATLLSMGPDVEGEIDLGGCPLNFGPRQYDITHGYAMKITVGRPITNDGRIVRYSPAYSDRVWLRVKAWELETGIAAVSNRIAVS